MISVSNIARAASAADYHREAWAISASEQLRQNSAEYYARDYVHTAWGGAGAQFAGFGAGSTVTKADFLAALEGTLRNADGTHSKLGKNVKNPETGQQEWRHRAGFDFTFAPPKSVSEAALIGRDERVIAVFHANVDKAMAYLEANAATYFFKNELRTDGNLLWSKFQHETARGAAKGIDPQMHAHVVIANAVYNEQTKTWQGLDNSALFVHRMAADAIFNAGLAHDLRTLGYELRPGGTNGSFEIEGISRQEIDYFSGRTAQIKEWLAEKGIEYSKASFAQQEAATQATRQNKIATDRDVLTSEWDSRAKSIGSRVHEIVEAARLKPQLSLAEQARLSAEHATRGAQLAVQHLAEREQVFDKKDLTRWAASFSGGASPEAINTAIGRLVENKVLLPHADKFTTHDAIERERALVSSVLAGKRTLVSIAKEESTLLVDMAALDAKRDFALNAGQKAAVALILTSKDKHLAVQGDPGTGKTTMLADANTLAAAQGVAMRGFAAGSAAAAVLGKETGMPATTIAQLLADLRKVERAGWFDPASRGDCGEDIQSLAKTYGLSASRAVWVFDEAGMISQADASQITSFADRLPGISLVWNGDVRQISNPAAGDPFRQMQEAGVALEKLTEIRRQKDAVGQSATRDAVADFRDIKVGDQLSVVAIHENTGFAPGGAPVYATGNDQGAFSNPAEAAFTEGRAAPHWAEIKNETTGEIQKINLPAEHGLRLGDQLSVVSKQDRDAIRVAAPVGEIELRGGIRAAFERLEKVEIEDNQQLVSRIAKDYAALSATERASTLIFTEANVDRRLINSAIRAELRAAGEQLAGQDFSREILVDKRLTEAEKQHVGSYAAGDVLIVGRSSKEQGLKTGEAFTVISPAADQKLLCANQKTGVQKEIDLAEKPSLGVFRQESIDVAAGDRIRFNKPDRVLGLANGTIGTVVSATADKMTVLLENGKSLQIDAAATRHFDHAYAVTSYGAQGATQDRGWCHVNGAAGNERTNLVNYTRAKNGTRVYSTNIADCQNTCAREADKTIALDARAEAIQQKAAVSAQKIDAPARPTHSEAEHSTQQKKSLLPAAQEGVSRPDAKRSLKADIDLAKAALETYRKVGSPDLEKLEKQGAQKKWDSRGNAYLVDRAGRVHAVALGIKATSTESRNLNHLGLTKSKYAIVKQRGLGGLLGFTTVLKQGGTLKSEAAGKLDQMLRNYGRNAGALGRAGAAIGQVALKPAQNWRGTGLAEAIGARVQIALENRAKTAKTLKALKEISASQPTRDAQKRGQQNVQKASKTRGRGVR